MNKQQLWERFRQTGSVGDYLAYRHAAPEAEEQGGKTHRPGSCDPGTKHR